MQPEGFTRVFPYIMANDGDRLLKFLEDGLGGELALIHRNPDGSIANAQIRFGDTTIMVSTARDEWKATYGTFYLYVSDAAAAFAQAIAAGGEARMEPAKMPYGEIQGGVTDPEGNIWWLSQRLSEKSY